MGVRTTLYAETPDIVSGVKSGSSLAFGGGPSLDLDKAAPGLAHFVGPVEGCPSLVFEPCPDVGGAEVRCFLPPEVCALHEHLSLAELSSRMDSSYGETIAFYPLQGEVLDNDMIDYLLSHARRLDLFLAEAANAARGMISVTL